MNNVGEELAGRGGGGQWNSLETSQGFRDASISANTLTLTHLLLLHMKSHHPDQQVETGNSMYPSQMLALSNICIEHVSSEQDGEPFGLLANNQLNELLHQTVCLAAV